MRNFLIIVFLMNFIKTGFWQLLFTAASLFGILLSVKLFGEGMFPSLFPLILLIAVIQMIASFKAEVPLRLALSLSLIMVIAWQIGLLNILIASAFLVIFVPFWAFMVMRRLEVSYLWASYLASAQLVTFIAAFYLFR